ncbi:MAG: hypothetical protein JSS67_09740 [Bacteroidetes bacterium]|nr:hypothetical protein [Bacteroidota bacterium]
MLSKITDETLDGLYKISAYKEVFSIHPDEPLLDKNIELFLNDFCSYNFADTNYAKLLDEHKNSVSPTEFADKASLEDILQYLTFYLWTNRSFSNYFKKKVMDGTIYRLLCRLHEILHAKQ